MIQPSNQSGQQLSGQGRDRGRGEVAVEDRRVRVEQAVGERLRFDVVDVDDVGQAEGGRLRDDRLPAESRPVALSADRRLTPACSARGVRPHRRGDRGPRDGPVVQGEEDQQALRAERKPGDRSTVDRDRESAQDLDVDELGALEVVV